MELKEGMYARAENGEIGKINVIIDGMVFLNTNQYYSTIKNTSNNIIDLIEVGDYVNEYKVIYQENCYSYFDIDTCEWVYIHNSDDIKSVVTKESFNSIKYEVN